MNLTTSVAEWSRSQGISRQQGYVAVKRCGIPVRDGKLDPDVASVLYRKHTRARAPSRPGRDKSAADPELRVDPVSGAVVASGNGWDDRGGRAGDAAASSLADNGGHVEGDGDYWHSRARREKAEAELAELKLREQQGELVRVADVRAAMASKLAAMRDALLQIPSRLVPILTAETDPAKIHQSLEVELHQALQFVSGEVVG